MHYDRDYAELAQQWHRTDHGDLIPPPREMYGVRFGEGDPNLTDSPCYCCCDLCKPMWSARPNPYWERAAYQELMRGSG